MSVVIANHTTVIVISRDTSQSFGLPSGGSDSLFVRQLGYQVNEEKRDSGFNPVSLLG